MQDVIRYHFSVLDSTNTWAKGAISQFKQNALTVVTADEQTTGRGQYGKRWYAPPSGNLYATFCLYQVDCKKMMDQLAESTQIWLKQLGLPCEIKAPNDLLVGKKKIAGLLGEVIAHETGSWSLVGLGLNVNMSAQELKKIDQPATSLAVEMGHPFDPQAVLDALLKLTTKG